MKISAITSSICIALIMLSHNLVLAQKNPMKYGKIDPLNFEMKYYPADSSADAIVLGSYGEIRIEYDQLDGFVLKFEKHFRAKIFNKNAYDLATYSLILYDYEGVTDKVMAFKGTVYNMENGKIIESNVDKKMIYEEPIDRRRRSWKFTLPNVKEGSVIEYSISVKSNHLTMPDWDFQYKVPALFSELYVAYPEFVKYKTLQKGFLGFTVNTSSIRQVSLSFSNIEHGERGTGNQINYDKFDYKENNYRWRIDSVPAFREEPYMNAACNYISSMNFELASYEPPNGIRRDYTRTWENINKELLEEEDFGMQLRRTGFLKETASQLLQNNISEEQKITAAYELVRNSMKWNGLNRLYTTIDLSKCWDQKAGNSAEINLVLVALLKEMGIDAEPVIISTRSNGIIHPGQIMLGQFNYVIVSAKTSDKSFLMDATEKACPYNMLTPRCINGQGRVISATRPGWVDLNSSMRYECTTMINASITPDGQIKGKIQRQYGNYAALEKRIEITGKKDLEEYKQSLTDNYAGLSIKDYQALELDKLGMPLGEIIDMEIRNNATVAGNLIIVDPLLFKEWDQNPFLLADRKFPVDYIYPRFYKDIINYQLPEGYIVDEKPTDMALSLPDGKGRFIFRVAQNGNTVQLNCMLDISKSLYTTEDYAALKEFYSTVIKKQAEKIVLKKAI